MGKTVSDSIGAILHKEPDWSLLPPSTPPTVRLLLRRCLTKDCRQRLQAIGDARVELEDARTADELLGAETTQKSSSSPILTALPWVLLGVLAIGMILRLVSAGRVSPSNSAADSASPEAQPRQNNPDTFCSSLITPSLIGLQRHAQQSRITDLLNDPAGTRVDHRVSRATLECTCRCERELHWRDRLVYRAHFPKAPRPQL